MVNDGIPLPRWPENIAESRGGC